MPLAYDRHAHCRRRLIMQEPQRSESKPATPLSYEPRGSPPPERYRSPYGPHWKYTVAVIAGFGMILMSVLPLFLGIQQVYLRLSSSGPGSREGRFADAGWFGICAALLLAAGAWYIRVGFRGIRLQKMD